MTLFDKIRKGLLDGFYAASDITSEYTKIGRIKIDILGVKKEIEEKMLELGGRAYDVLSKSSDFNLENATDIKSVINEIKNLENELKMCEQELKRIKSLDETTFIEKK
ncbi:MAG: hypothetical protein H6627_09725 [Calditrichae bacterium]|nr:hypothetical protein [Calditrichota bacterium]MCB9058834.1 hypothetical protein [Calditrichia bacterium]